MPCTKKDIIALPVPDFGIMCLLNPKDKNSVIREIRAKKTTTCKKSYQNLVNCLNKICTTKNKNQSPNLQ